jgi:hypothetical protein
MPTRTTSPTADGAGHDFLIVIPVADRPGQLRACLDSLLAHCRAWGYGGFGDGAWSRVAVMIADDSAEPDSIAGNRTLAAHYTRQGLRCEHFGPLAQARTVAALPTATRRALAGVIGAAPDGEGIPLPGHKGQAVMRNIAYLAIARRLDAAAAARTLIWSVDSDQEFRVRLAGAAGDHDVDAFSYFHRLDEIFSAGPVEVLTGKVVGDPPVSPAVMCGNFLADVNGFLARLAAADPDGACRQHEAAVPGQGEAAYHDHAGLFGFPSADAPQAYRCRLPGPHRDADCFATFAARLAGFFEGGHPTRISYHREAAAWQAVAPARTVYAGNYVFRPAALRHFIPFATLRLRMSGPTLGRLLRAELGDRFVAANLPLLHRRTIEATGRAEFRPGVLAAPGRPVDLAGEFERQFIGDVALFSIERLAGDTFPPTAATTLATLEGVRTEMLARYADKRATVGRRLAELQARLADPERWWNRHDGHGEALAAFRRFSADVAANFGPGATGFARIDDETVWERWRTQLLAGIAAFPEERRHWQAALALPGA